MLFPNKMYEAFNYNLSVVIGNAQHRAADPSVIEPLGVHYFRRIGKIKSGDWVKIIAKNGVYFDRDALFASADFNFYIVSEDYTKGEAFFNGKPTDTTKLSVGFPYYGEPDPLKRFSGSFGAKGGHMIRQGIAIYGPGIRLEGFTNGDNRPAIYLANGSATLHQSDGKYISLDGPTNLIVDGAIIRHNDNGIRTSVMHPNSWILIRHAIIEQNGIGDGQSHDLYIENVGAMVVAGNTIRNSIVGHAIKSRVRLLVVFKNDLRDTAEVPKASSCVVDASGGMNFIYNNKTGQGPNDSNPGKENYFYTDRMQDGNGPHCFIYTGNDDYSSEAYRGVVVRISNVRRNPDQSTWLKGMWQNAPQLLAADGTPLWNTVLVGIAGNDVKFARGKLSYGTTIGGVYEVPTNSGIKLLKPLTDNRLIASDDPNAQINAAKTDYAMIRAHKVGAIFVDWDVDDFTIERMQMLADVSVAEQAAWVSPEDAYAAAQNENLTPEQIMEYEATIKSLKDQLDALGVKANQDLDAEKQRTQDALNATSQAVLSAVNSVKASIVADLNALAQKYS